MNVKIFNTFRAIGLPPPPMTSLKIISICCAVFLAGCGGASTGPAASGDAAVLNAKTVVTYQRSLSAMESGMDAAQKAELSRAINAIIMFPESGDCALEARLKHTEKFKDSAFRQRIQFDRLHGLTAQQILNLGKERACETPTDVTMFEGGAAADAHIAPAESTPDEKEPSKSPAASAITLNAPTYMLPDLTPQYATLRLHCGRGGKIIVSLTDSDVPTTISVNGSIVRQTGEVIPRWGPFWQRNTVFFDETLAEFPPLYETSTKKVPVGNGRFESRTEQAFIGHNIIRDMIVPKLKTARKMRLENHFNGGLGPTFDLTRINADVTRLEAECTPEALGE